MKKLSSNINYISRYSSTDEPDERGRWARVAYFKNKIQIAWISLVTFVDKQGETQKTYLVTCHFPTLCNDTANNHYSGKTFEEAKEWLKKEWDKFLKIVTD